MTQSRSIVGVIAGLVAGVVVGSAVTWQLMRAPPLATAPARTPVAREVRAQNAPGSGLVPVRLENQRSANIIDGILLADHNVVLIALDRYDTTTRGAWRDGGGTWRELGPAVAWDFILGIAAFRVDDASRDGLVLSEENGSLYIGRDLEMLGVRDGGGTRDRMDVFVNSAAIATPSGAYRFEIRALVTTRSGYPLLVPGTRTLVGMVLGFDRDQYRPPGSLDAVDAATLSELLTDKRSATPVSLGRFNRLFSASLIALKRRLIDASERSQWQQALVAGNQLVSSYGDHMTWQLTELARTAHLRRAEELLAEGNAQMAIRTARSGIARFGEDAALTRVVVQGRHARGEIDAALASAQAFFAAGANERDPAVADLRSVLRELVIARTTGSSVSKLTAVNVLKSAIDEDDYAAYHRHLGVTLFELGRYAEAEFHLGRAVELEPTYATELAHFIRQSAQRRSISGLIEAPLDARGNALFVNVRLNGRPEPYRFLLDTGASYTAIKTETVLRLGLNEVFARGAPLIELETANGRRYAQTFKLASIAVGGAVVNEVPVVVLEEMSGVDGLLGLSFLNHFDVDIDQRGSKLLLTPR